METRYPRCLIRFATAWAALTTGAYCYFNNDSATYAAIYGKLYNWYAVNDPRGLAPEGWHIPSDFEWTTLINTLGGSASAGGPMKAMGTEHWNDAQFRSYQSLQLRRPTRRFSWHTRWLQ